MGLMVRRCLMQAISHLPGAGSCKQGKYPEEHSCELQPQNARQLYKRSPHRPAKAFATLCQACLRLSHLGRRPRSLLHQSNARGCRLVLCRRCLYPSRRVRRGRCVHRRHQRLGSSASPKSQRTSEPNRIHTMKCSLLPYFRETLRIEKRIGPLPHPTFNDGTRRERGGHSNEEFYLDGRSILRSSNRFSHLEPRPHPSHTGTGSQPRSRLGRPSYRRVTKISSLHVMSLPRAEAERILYRARQQYPQCRSPPLLLGREYPMRG